MASLLEIQKMLQNFSQDRPTLSKNNTPKRLLELTQVELGEVGDSLYDPDHLGTEISDSIILLLSLANEYGLDMDKEIREKIAVNIIRYEARFFKDGDYDQSKKYVKSIEKPIIEEFYRG